MTHTYMIKNTSESTICLTDGNIEVVLKHHEVFTYKSDMEDMGPHLTKLYNAGNIDYWHFEVPDGPDTKYLWEHEKGSWLKEGF